MVGNRSGPTLQSQKINDVDKTAKLTFQFMAQTATERSWVRIPPAFYLLYTISKCVLN